MKRRQRQSLVALVAGTLVASVAAAGVYAAGTAPAPARGDGEGPTALSAHLEQLRQTVPGQGGEAEEGPASAAADDYAKLAYPDGVVSVKEMDAARAAFSKAVNRFPKGKGRKGSWVTVGPSKALYPDTEFRNASNYVPNEYVAGGRTTSVAIAETCRPGSCRMYITAAGGGVWRTDNALAGTPSWKYLGGPLGINAAGTVALDPNDKTGNTVYAGTGEANVCGSGCVAGVGMYKSTDGGATWQGPLGKAALGGKGIGSIVVVPGDPKTVYAATTTALRGMSSVCCAGVTRPVPDAQKWGLYKSTDGGTTWGFVHNGSETAAQCSGSTAEFNNQETCSPRGVREVVLDPSDPDTLYAASYARGVWRSTDAGASWTQIKPSLNSAVTFTRPAIAVAELEDGKTRMYVHEGNVGLQYSRLFRSDDVATGTPEFTDLTSSSKAEPGYATFNQCGGQCWYDLFVHSPKGHPDIVYTGGSYAYRETGRLSNGRAVVLSTDAGVSGTDMTMDATDPVHPNGLHPDQHDLVTNPSNPFQFFETNDGGVMRSSGTFSDVSSWCADRRLPTDADRARCEQLLSRVPSKLEGMNQGLRTLQFMSLSVDPRNPERLQGGTQDNGTWETDGNPVEWRNTMIGDGGQSGFDAVKPEMRFHNFFDATPEVNFDNGDIGDWIWTADPLFRHAGTQFYAPVISDPKVSGTMFAGTGRTVYRTTTHGLGDRSLEEAHRICNTWTGTFEAKCGDWAETGPTRLTAAAAAFGEDRAGGAVAAVERTTADTSTAWAATTTGRVFISTNVDADDPAAVSWTRVDDDAAIDPNRFVSGIHVDPKNPDRAYVSYSGFSSATPGTPGHVFRVEFDGTEATWTDVSHDLQDLPITDVVLDDVTGDLYASSDFGVLTLAAGTSTWTAAAPGMPNAEVTGLTVVPGSRILYAASHGLGAWRLNLG